MIQNVFHYGDVEVGSTLRTGNKY